MVGSTKTEELSSYLGTTSTTIDVLGGIIATIGGFATVTSSGGQDGNGGVNGSGLCEPSGNFESREWCVDYWAVIRLWYNRNRLFMNLDFFIVT